MGRPTCNEIKYHHLPEMKAAVRILCLCNSHITTAPDAHHCMPSSNLSGKMTK